MNNAITATFGNNTVTGSKGYIAEHATGYIELLAGKRVLKKIALNLFLKEELSFYTMEHPTDGLGIYAEHNEITDRLYAEYLASFK